MQRTTIMLPEDLKRRAMRRARELGISFGEFVRTCMEDELRPKKQDRAGERDPLYAVPVHKGKVPADLSKNIDTYLYDEDER
ncbi:MAG: hypothetical protein HY291_03575 [Planctomycetes bacterium]|nr:hypothetical protein [Planctomycetota bacterium]